MTSNDDRPARVFVYGSCVARDTLDFATQPSLEIAGYVARQSMLSAGNDASSHLQDEVDVRSRFQLRMIQGDFAGSLLKRLADAGDIDVLLWDLADERHGVHRFPDGTFATRSIDNIRVPAIAHLMDAAEYLPFGSAEHLALWKQAATSFTQSLRELSLLERTIVLEVPWALRTTEGATTPWSMGLRAPDANRLYEPYYAHLRQLGHTMLQVPADLVVADPNHRWGLAPFHYAPELYRSVLTGVREHGVTGLKISDAARPAPPANGPAATTPGRSTSHDRLPDFSLAERRSSDTTVVVFTGLGQQVGGLPPFEFSRTLENLGVNSILLRDPRLAWYHDAIDGWGGSLAEKAESLKNMIADVGGDRVHFLGTSSGGFAALMFATLIPVDRVVTLGAQGFIDIETRRAFGDERWGRALIDVNRIAEGSYTDLRHTDPVQAAHGVVSVFGSKSTIDGVHALYVDRHARAPVETISVEGGHHAVALDLKRDGTLYPFLEAALTGAGIDDKLIQQLNAIGGRHRLQRH